MKRKIIGIILCMLLIATITPLVSSTKVEKTSANLILMPSVIDQQQPNTSENYMLISGDNWQQFKNRGKTLESVDLHIGSYAPGMQMITLEIAESLTASPLTSVTYTVNDLPFDTQDWFTFDFPDVGLTSGKTYYIIVTFWVPAVIRWSGSHGNLYKPGASSHPDADWDFAFRTIVDKSKIKGLESPLLYFLENHPYLFPILRKFFGI